MEFASDITFFDNEDSINFFNFLLKKNFPIDKITLLPCTKMKNRINIQIILNNYKTTICPVKTTYHWFAVTRQHIHNIKELTSYDVDEFSAEKKDFDKLFNYIWGDDIIPDITRYIEKMKKKISEIKNNIIAN